LRAKTTTSRKVRGFTLIELMVVVVIIAILAVIAVPLFSSRLVGRRVFQAAGRMADVYRGSRTRALARGAAVVVTLNTATDALSVLEGVQGTVAATAAGANRAACGNLPSRGCLTNDWSNIGSGATIGTTRLVEGVADKGIDTAYTVGNGTKTTSGNVSICFSPGGRTYVNTAGTWTAPSWSQLTGPIVIEVKGAGTTPAPPRVYRVVVLPNGAARMTL
jgi:prepilin-type N-terminal cleavage/methylation domain-containing protein